MSLRRLALLALALSPALFSMEALAARVYVEPATGSGVASSDLETASDLVRTSVPDVSANEVVDQAGQADLVLRPKLIRLGQAYVLGLSKVKNGETLFSSQLKAERMDELDKVARRLTRSVIEGRRASTHPRVGEITDQEAHDGAQRRPTRRALYLGLGGASLGNLNTTGLGYSLGIAYAWDVNRALVKLIGEGAINGSAFFASGGIGADYFLSMEDIAPYIGADFGAGVAKIDEGGVLDGQTVGGFVVGVGAGVQLLRTSSVNLDLGFRAGFLLHENALGAPRVLSLRLGLYF